MTHCSVASTQALEPIFGTGADETLHWIAVEVRGPWRAKALVDNQLSAPVQDWLREQKARPGTRPLFIKRRGKRQGITVFYVNVVLGRVHRFELTDYEELLTIPWSELRAGSLHQGLSDEQPIFVCTHSTRDHCCGLHGPAVARELESELPGQVWQCTHLGGHRFAATLVAMPQGVHFGRVRASECHHLARELGAGRVYDLQRFRGLVRYPPAVQAAEASIRQAHNLTSLEAVSAESYTQEKDHWKVVITTNDSRHNLRVHRESTATLTPSSCGADPTPIARWAISPDP